MALSIEEMRLNLEQDALDRRQKRLDRAHQRRMESRANAIESGLSVSPQERAEVMRAVGRDEGTKLRAHELNVIGEQGKWNVATEKERSAGLRGQGAEAMQIRADADRYVADQTRLTEVEKANILKEGSRAQHGYFDENGEYHPGSTVKAAEAAGLSKTELELAKQEARLTEMERRNQFIGEQNQLAREQKEQQFEKKEQRLTTQQQQKDLEKNTSELQKIYTAASKGEYIKSGMTPSQWEKMTDSQKRAWAQKQLVPSNQQAGGAGWKTRYNK